MPPAPASSVTTAAGAPDRQQPYWLRVRILTLLCLLAWFGVTFFVIYYARELSEVRFFGWPLSFYMAAQGLTLIYVAIIGVYALLMHVFDRQRRQGAGDGH